MHESDGPPVTHPNDVPRILVVDDDLLCRKMVIRRLHSLGFDCDDAVNGCEAVKKVMAAEKNLKQYAAIIMDFTMPVLIGPFATELIREFGFRGKVFAVTGNTLEEDVADFLMKGADRVCPKPLTTEDYAFIKMSIAWTDSFRINNYCDSFLCLLCQFFILFFLPIIISNVISMFLSIHCSKALSSFFSVSPYTSPLLFLTMVVST